MKLHQDTEGGIPVRIYRRVDPPQKPSRDVLAKFRVVLPDRPGSLAALAAQIAEAEGNISFFHYDRAVNAGRVAVEAQFFQEEQLRELLSLLGAGSAATHAAAGDELAVTSLESILEITVRLENRPGSLAAFSRVLAAHDANVIYMLYDEDIDEESADIALATKAPAEVDRLLRAMNEAGSRYRVKYRGAAEQEVAQVIGLNMVERFFLRLKKLLPASDVEELSSIVQSSRELQQDLVRFYAEAGDNLDAAEVFEKVLTLASRSRSWTGPRFHARAMERLQFGDVTIHGFRLPTSENVFALQAGEETVLIDTGHGIYHDDLKQLLAGRGMAPAQVARIYLTHPDTDHAGGAGWFEREFGTEVFMHPGGREVIATMNRAHGASGSLLNLNKYYTRLSARFTECRYPERPNLFETRRLATRGGFSVIGAFSVGSLRFEVLESLGGHTPGLVFYLNPEQGLLFTSDFLLNVPSLQPDEKEHLGLYRYLLTSPNRDSAVYKQESEALLQLARSLNREPARAGAGTLIFPGHGAYYALE